MLNVPTAHNYVRKLQDEIYQTNCIPACTSPEWKEDFQWEFSNAAKFLTVSVMDRVS
jgi:hypothetical protein